MRLYLYLPTMSAVKNVQPESELKTELSPRHICCAFRQTGSVYVYVIHYFDQAYIHIGNGSS